MSAEIINLFEPTEGAESGPFDRMFPGTLAALDRLTVRPLPVEHDCPWVGGCRCVEDRTLCSCGHQNAYHLRDFDPGLADDSWMLFQMQGEPAEWSRCEAGVANDLKHEEPCACERFTAVSS